MMEPLSESIRKRVNSYGQEKAFSASQVLAMANRVLPPGHVAKTVKEDRLTIEVATSAEAYFFKQELDDYLERINAALSKPMITKIYIRVKHT